MIPVEHHSMPQAPAQHDCSVEASKVHMSSFPWCNRAPPVAQGDFHACEHTKGSLRTAAQTGCL